MLSFSVVRTLFGQIVIECVWSFRDPARRRSFSLAGGAGRCTASLNNNRLWKKGGECWGLWGLQGWQLAQINQMPPCSNIGTIWVGRKRIGKRSMSWGIFGSGAVIREGLVNCQDQENVSNESFKNEHVTHSVVLRILVPSLNQKRLWLLQFFFFFN